MYKVLYLLMHHVKFINIVDIKVCKKRLLGIMVSRMLRYNSVNNIVRLVIIKKMICLGSITSLSQYSTYSLIIWLYCYAFGVSTNASKKLLLQFCYRNVINLK